MPDDSDNKPDHLRGTSQLTVEAVLAVVDIVEAMHRTISTFGGLLAGGQLDRTTGLTGMVYRNIRAVTNLVGAGIDVALEEFAERLNESGPTSANESLLAAVNGVLGDYLVATDNPLAIPMEFRQDGRAVSADDAKLHAAVRKAGGRVLLMVHGSSSNDLQWLRKGHDHGQALAEELGYVPIYLRYNSGRHISENGADLAALLDGFTAELPELTELSILAHSMGGLVARSACHYAEEAGHAWRERLRNLVFLATPHHGALLERSGNWLHQILQISAYSAPISRLAKIRSAGVTDLRYGNLVHEDWRDCERFELSTDCRQPVPLPKGVACYAVAATTAATSTYVTDHVVGDGLVQLDSALGRHEDPKYDLGLDEAHQFVARRCSHLDVLCKPEVYEVLGNWLTSRKPA
ncbi:esterase/lipase family protein [Persicimonas caeni]|uniref:esterase/lipase family protein n=1 Tax=Persicimonas caeni TaxID=2292766 RepID=UPI001C9A9936|nr:GPI inositol-deacylase [Persicimonas caeni]